MCHVISGGRCKRKDRENPILVACWYINSHCFHISKVHEESRQPVSLLHSSIPPGKPQLGLPIGQGDPHLGRGHLGLDFSQSHLDTYPK